ncbi:MAG: hypothetical protein RX318_06960 [bacterium]|nr:hypothetical protein [bacterium]
MKILGIILLIIGGFWTFSRLLNQGIMFRLLKKQIEDGGLIFAIRRYLVAELFAGLGLGITIMAIGFYLFTFYR